MKKMIFSAAAFGLVAVSSMALAPTSAEAIPAFARQTGAACLSCHFQEIPALSPFGRAFKMGSFTDVGDEGLVEDDGLSIPVSLNASMVVRMNVEHVSGGSATDAGVTSYSIPADANFLVAGRVGTNTGAFVEFGGGAGDTGTGFNNFQLLNSFDMGGFKVGFGYASDSFGGSSVLEVSSVFGQHSGAVGDVGAVSAVNNSGFTNSMSQIGAWIGNDLGYIQVALIAPGGGAGWAEKTAGTAAASATQGTVNVGTKLGKLVRVVATLDVGGFDTVIGLGLVAGKAAKSGSNANGGAGTVSGVTGSDMKLQFVDFQMQGETGDMAVGLYADWAHAKGTANGNLLGAQDAGVTAPIGTAADALGIGQVLDAAKTFDAYSVRATAEPISGITVGLGYGYRKTKDSVNTANSVNVQTLRLGTGYSLYQNSIISLSYANVRTTTGTTAAVNVKTTTLDWLTLM